VKSRGRRLVGRGWAVDFRYSLDWAAPHSLKQGCGRHASALLTLGKLASSRASFRVCRVLPSLSKFAGESCNLPLPSLRPSWSSAHLENFCAICHQAFIIPQSHSFLDLPRRNPRLTSPLGTLSIRTCSIIPSRPNLTFDAIVES